MTLEAIKWNREENKLVILDQTLLPDMTLYLHIEDVQNGWKAINMMKVNLRMFFSEYFAMFIRINYLILI